MFVHQVFGQLAISEESPGEGPHGLVMVPIQALQRPQIAPADALDQSLGG